MNKRIITGFIELMTIWGVLLFLPAWSLNFWQGWVYWFAFFITIITGTIYFVKKDPKLIEHRLRSGPQAEKEKSQKIIQAFAGFFTFSMIAFSGFDYRFGWSSVPWYLVIIGNILAVISLLLIFRVLKENSYASSIVEVGSEQKVISTGPYRIVRHPMYSAAVLFFLFSPFALGSYWALIFAFGVNITICFRLADEEKYLMKNLTGYTDYCLNVRYRLIPLIW